MQTDSREPEGREARDDESTPGQVGDQSPTPPEGVSEGVTSTEEVRSGTPPQAPGRDVQRGGEGAGEREKLSPEERERRRALRASETEQARERVEPQNDKGWIARSKGALMGGEHLSESRRVQGDGPPTTTEKKPTWTWRHTAGVLVSTLLIFGGGLYTGTFGIDGCNDYKPGCHNAITWVWTMVLLILSIVIIGRGAAGRSLGVLIDDRNQMSLSRMQITLWTILILSTIVTMAMFHIRWGLWWGYTEGITAALNMTVPVEIWALLGISTASLVTAGLIKSKQGDEQLTKEKNQQLDDEVKELATPSSNGTEAKRITRQGVLIKNEDAKDASYGEMFTGDQVAGAALVDIGKVQMFFFTILLVLVYGVMVFSLFLNTLYTNPEDGTYIEDTTQVLNSLPTLETGMVVFLAISHAGYLTTKAITLPAPNTTETKG